MKKSIFWIILVLVVLSVILMFTNRFKLKDIPALVGFVGWGVVAFNELFWKISAKIRIFLKGFFLDTRVKFLLKMKNIGNKQQFLDEIQVLKSGYKFTKLSRINNDQYQATVIVKEKIKLEFSIKFSVDYNFDGESSIQNDYALFEFEPIQNRHSKIVEYGKTIDQFIRFLEAKRNTSDSLCSVMIKYINDNNPLISEVIKGNSKINIHAEGEHYSMDRGTINVECDSITFLKTLEQILNGDLSE